MVSKRPPCRHIGPRRASIFLPVKIGSLTCTHTPPPSVGGRERRLDPYPPTVSAPTLPYPTQRLSQTQQSARRTVAKLDLTSVSLDIRGRATEAG